MADSYIITEKQKAVLEQFTCERLKQSPDNLNQIQYFHSWKGGGLVRSLRSNGWREDNLGTTAYYVVKNPDGEIVLFFSLKCGVLFDPTYMKQMEGLLNETEMLRSALIGAKHGNKECFHYLVSEMDRLGEDEFSYRVKNIDKHYGHKSSFIQEVAMDKDLEANSKIIRVDESHSAIELVEFCTNDITKNCWKRCGMGHRRMGETLFWWFIVPKMLQISRLVGCEYAYLFAADVEGNLNGKLVRYYENVCRFRKFDRLGAVKPTYDTGCFFMCKRLLSLAPDMAEDEDWKGLDECQREFFENFNRPEETGKDQENGQEDAK